MDTRIATKRDLKKLNKRAIDAGGRALTDEFFEQLRGDLKYPVWEMLTQERGWIRCFVGFGSSPLGDDFQTVMLDMQQSDFQRLPCRREACAVQSQGGVE